MEKLDKTTKTDQVLSALKSISGNISNEWKAKEREQYIRSKLLQIEWLIDGDFLKEDSKFIKKIKEHYFNYDHESVNSTNFPNDYYLIYEPFGGNSSPDFLFFTPKGIFSLEDKGSDNGHIYWNTGSPGENKIISFYHQKEEKMYLITTLEYGWTMEIQNEYREFTQHLIDYAREEYRKRFVDKNISDLIRNTKFYARPMLEDMNFVSEFCDPDEINVRLILDKYLTDNVVDVDLNTTPTFHYPPLPTPTQLSFEF